MSRVASNPIPIPAGVEVTIGSDEVTVKGPKGELGMSIHSIVKVNQEEGQLKIGYEEDSRSSAMAGTTRALLANMVKGVYEGWEKKLTIIGVGYRAQAQGKKLNLTLGFSHPIVYDVPEGVVVETPTQTEVVIKGSDKQQVGQTAAEIRQFRPPEPYKGKGVRYSDEHVVRKQAKKT
ncbi:MAG: 50S ribosomal protein L6 [Arenicellales bacterium]|jgi:large subunit ribosomal protein L6|nr:50S ribosomal protein L6 [Acidiferrobacteraceae bacterium]MDP6123290.1 50S ribosomal protein L6 [Arenicellales bacterium]MBT58228.1 50S ribosomal protein L6 [Acidiferrobacteraceae bacterium]MDP6290029.1 50S ribosomal protein L6 [Arenicellales bacterium]MDP6434018.1 50S ribosomal protein L6 [Arenicellales bacterium]|tara:strand:- start:2056 stop:2586 length:531 start_codon:yes stop_codon:yes gene_type:complete